MIPFHAFPRRRLGEIRCVVTIHDLIPLMFPHYAPRARKTKFFRLFRRIMLETAMRADMILAPSASSRNDIIRHLKIPPGRHGRVQTIYEGVDSFFTPDGEDKPSSKTILYVGRLDPYKNVVGLVEAFALVQRAIPDASLRIIGPRDERYPEASERIQELDLASKVRWDGYVEAGDLREAYRSARVFTLPSRYEGFGLPVLEAMACGTPVVCSNVSSLPEVAGQAALQVSPDDPVALADALKRVLTDSSLAADLRRKGLERADAFTWDQTARATQSAYEAIGEMQADT
jgi:glycosyltransferase involved in cell wall biosynthesis